MEINKNEIKQTTVAGDNKVSKKEETTPKSPFNLKLEMSVIDASIVYVKTENAQGFEEDTDIEKGVNISYVNLEVDEEGNDFINEQSVYIDYKWEMFKERGDELINKLVDNDIKLIEPQENSGLFAKGFKILGKTDEPFFTLNRSMKFKIMTILDKSSTFNRKTEIKTEIGTIYKGAKSKKIAINLLNIPKAQVDSLKNKEVLVEYISARYNEKKKITTYSTIKLPKVI